MAKTGRKKGAKNEKDFVQIKGLSGERKNQPVALKNKLNAIKEEQKRLNALSKVANAMPSRGRAVRGLGKQISKAKIEAKIEQYDRDMAAIKKRLKLLS
jgi:hypothetical protein